MLSNKVAYLGWLLSLKIEFRFIISRQRVLLRCPVSCHDLIRYILVPGSDPSLEIGMSRYVVCADTADMQSSPFCEGRFGVVQDLVPLPGPHRVLGDPRPVLLRVGQRLSML